MNSRIELLMAVAHLHEDIRTGLETADRGETRDQSAWDRLIEALAPPRSARAPRGSIGGVAIRPRIASDRDSLPAEPS